MQRRLRVAAVLIAAWLASTMTVGQTLSGLPGARDPGAPIAPARWGGVARPTEIQKTVSTYCVTCHNARLKTAGLVYHKDFLVDYVKTGKRSYGIVAQMADQPAQDERPLFAKLSDNFELCVTGLGFVRSDLDRMKNPAYQQAKDLLLN